MISEKYRREILSEPQYFIKRPSFIDGLASNHDLFNVKNAHLHLTPKIDFLGMKSDFDLVGKYLYDAIRKYRNEFAVKQ